MDFFTLLLNNNTNNKHNNNNISSVQTWFKAEVDIQPSATIERIEE